MPLADARWGAQWLALPSLALLYPGPLGSTPVGSALAGEAGQWWACAAAGAVGPWAAPAIPYWEVGSAWPAEEGNERWELEWE